VNSKLSGDPNLRLMTKRNYVFIEWLVVLFFRGELLDDVLALSPN